MYSVEYKWTSVEIKVTTTSIIPVRLSKQKDQSIVNESIWIQWNKLNITTCPEVIVLYKKHKDNKKDVKVHKVVIKQTPGPKRYPNRLPLKNPRRGKKIISKSII